MLLDLAKGHQRFQRVLSLHLHKLGGLAGGFLYQAGLDLLNLQMQLRRSVDRWELRFELAKQICLPIFLPLDEDRRGVPVNLRLLFHRHGRESLSGRLSWGPRDW